MMNLPQARLAACSFYGLTRSKETGLTQRKKQDLLRANVNNFTLLRRFFDFWNMEGSQALTGVSLAQCSVAKTARHLLLHDSKARLPSLEERP